MLSWVAHHLSTTVTLHWADRHDSPFPRGSCSLLPNRWLHGRIPAWECQQKMEVGEGEKEKLCWECTTKKTLESLGVRCILITTEGSMLLEREESAVREMPHRERKEDVQWAKGCCAAGGEHAKLESSKWQRKSSIWQEILKQRRKIQEKKSRITKKIKYKGKMIVGSDSLASIHGICVIARRLKLSWGLLKEGGMRPAGEKDKTKSRRDTEKVFLSYHHTHRWPWPQVICACILLPQHLGTLCLWIQPVWWCKMQGNEFHCPHLGMRNGAEDGYMAFIFFCFCHTSKSKLSSVLY